MIDGIITTTTTTYEQDTLYNQKHILTTIVCSLVDIIINKSFGGIEQLTINMGVSLNGGTPQVTPQNDHF